MQILSIWVIFIHSFYLNFSVLINKYMHHNTSEPWLSNIYSTEKSLVLVSIKTYGIA